MKPYLGAMAVNYEARRINGDKWQREQTIIEDMIAGLDGTVLDVPVGTGRFADAYCRRRLTVAGLDLSPDMLAQASGKGFDRLLQGNILALPFLDDAFDAAVCVRLLSWLSWEQALLAIHELGRVAGTVILTAPVGRPQIRPNGVFVHNRDALLAAALDCGLTVRDDRSYAGKGCDNMVVRLAR